MLMFIKALHLSLMAVVLFEAIMQTGKVGQAHFSAEV